MTIKHYIQKEVEITAVRYDGTNSLEIISFTEDQASFRTSGRLQLLINSNKELVPPGYFIVNSPTENQFVMYPEARFNTLFNFVEDVSTTSIYKVGDILYSKVPDGELNDYGIIQYITPKCVGMAWGSYEEGRGYGSYGSLSIEDSETNYTTNLFEVVKEAVPVPVYEDIEIVTHCGCKGVVTVTTGVMGYIKPLVTFNDGRPTYTNREFGDTGEVSNGRRVFEEK